MIKLIVDFDENFCRIAVFSPSFSPRPLVYMHACPFGAASCREKGCMGEVFVYAKVLCGFPKSYSHTLILYSFYACVCANSLYECWGRWHSNGLTTSPAPKFNDHHHHHHHTVIMHIIRVYSACGEMFGIIFQKPNVEFGKFHLFCWCGVVSELGHAYCEYAMYGKVN